MNHYDRHIGDWLKDTVQLSACEEGIYSRLIDQYYSREKPLPLDLVACCRLARSQDKDERAAVSMCLDAFFIKCDDGYHHKRCDEVIGIYQQRSEHNRRVGKLGGRPRTFVPHGTKPERLLENNPEETHVVYETKPVLEPDNNPSQYPVPSTHKPTIKRVPTPDGVGVLGDQTPKDPIRPDGDQQPDNCPHAEIISIYHRELPMLPEVREWNETRRKFLRMRWREKPERQTLDWWREFFRYVARCPFLVGNGRPSADREPFVADLEWLVRPTNFVKVIEGKYEPRSAPQRPGNGAHAHA